MQVRLFDLESQFALIRDDVRTPDTYLSELRTVSTSHRIV